MIAIDTSNKTRIKYYPQCVYGPLEWSMVCWFDKTIINVTWYIFNGKLNKKDGGFFHPYKLQFVAYLMSFTRNLSFVFFLGFWKREIFHSLIASLLFFWHFFSFQYWNFELQSNQQTRYANSMALRIHHSYVEKKSCIVTAIGFGKMMPQRCNYFSLFVKNEKPTMNWKCWLFSFWRGYWVEERKDPKKNHAHRKQYM